MRSHFHYSLARYSAILNYSATTSYFEYPENDIVPKNVYNVCCRGEGHNAEQSGDGEQEPH